MLDECGTVGKDAFRSTKPMKLLLALLAGLALALYVLALADGPSLLDIINRF